MKGKNRIYFLTFALLSLLSFFLYSCIDDEADLRNVKNIDEAARKKEISEARAFFENHVASIPLDAKPQGMYPGNFATDWDNAAYVENTADSIISVNACIVPEYYYEGDFAKDYTRTPETDEDWYHTVISQKVVSLKDMRNGARCCYIITLIPDATCATQSRAEIDWLFNNGESNGEFSGLVVYSVIETNTALVADRYQKGKLIARTSLFEENNIDEPSLMGYCKISQYKPIRTKYDFLEDSYTSNTTGWSYSGTGSGSSSCGFCGSGVSYNSGSNTIYVDTGYSGSTNPNPSDRGEGAMNNSSGSNTYYPPSGSSNGGGSNPETPSSDPTNPTVYVPNVYSTAYNNISIELATKINLIMPDIAQKLANAGVSLLGISIVTKPDTEEAWCKAYARITPEKQVQICSYYLGLERKDQVAILFHEIYHIKNDVPTELQTKKLSRPLSLSGPPANIRNYIYAQIDKKRLEFYQDFGYEEITTREEEYENLTSVENINSPGFYRNEIAAYEAEKVKFPDNAVSSQYAAEREWKLWQNKERLKIANLYY